MSLNFFASFVVQNPWGFIALLGLVVPIVLHLISKSQPIQIKFSNIALIDDQQPKSMRKVRLTEFWLLLLRLLLLLFSILLLAQLFLTKPLIKNEEIYLVSADWLNQSSTTQRQQLIEQALKQPIYLLNRKTKLITDDEILQWQPKPNVQTQNILQTENILQNLVSFSELLTPETHIDLFVTDRASQYKLSGQGRKYKIKNIIVRHIINTIYQADTQYADEMNVVLIYDQDRFEAVKYFEKAFALIKQETAAKLSFTYFDRNSLDTSVPYQQALNSKPDWLFYLSSHKLDHKIMQALSTGTNLFVDAQNPQENSLLSTTSKINKNSSALLDTEAMFYQRAMPLDVAEQLNPKPTLVYKETLWQFSQPDGSSAVMLTKTSHSYSNSAFDNSAKESIVNEDNGNENTIIESNGNESNIYQLYSRFTPSWSNLIVSKEFPLLLQTLLFQQWQTNRLVEQQPLTHAQIRQLVISNESPVLSNNRTASLEDKVIEKNDADKASAIRKTTRLKSGKDLIVEQQSTENYWTELLTLLIILLWTLERIISEFYRSKSSLVLEGVTNINSTETNNTPTVASNKVDA